ncbi:MAG: 50S ribosome-binding GTPase [Chlamydiia bacterium]|nr:50S ribosome-binding GTPase [Chlamydiia bacterium]
MSASSTSCVQKPFTNHQGFTIAFSKYQGKLVCCFSQGDILLGTNIPLFISKNPPPLSAYTITYYPSRKAFVWGSYGLSGGMRRDGDTFHNFGTVTNQGTVYIGTQNNTFYTLSAADFDFIQDRMKHPFEKLELDRSMTLLRKCIEEGNFQAKKAKGKEVILFIGNTGAGKSTTINYLCGCTLEMVSPENLGIEDAIDNLVIVKGVKKEVMPIGHTRQSKTFMPQIEEDQETHNTYMDCPGFFDNRGVEINIANSINIKNSIQESKTIKVVILINYHSLKAERGRGLTEMLRVAYNLFGGEQNLLNAKESLLLGVTNVPLDLNFTRLKKFLTKDSYILQNLADRIFTYDPLDRKVEGAWNRKAFLEALKGLKPVRDHKEIFSTILTYEDKNKLLQISEAIREKIKEALKQKNYKEASEHYLELKTLSVIEHHIVERLFQAQRKEIESHAHEQVNAFISACHLENFSEAEEILKFLELAVQNFQELDKVIDLPIRKRYCVFCKEKQRNREYEFQKYQEEIQSANKMIEEYVELIERQKDQVNKQLSEQEENHAKLLSALESTSNQKLKDLEISMNELLNEEKARLQKTEEELKITQAFKDQDINKKLLEERNRLEEQYQQKIKSIEEEKVKIFQEKEALLKKQQEAHNQKKQEIQSQIQILETQKIQHQRLQRGVIPEMAFGKAKWEKYFGNIGFEPPLPKHIEEILNRDCPFWKGKKVRDTHLLVLIPNEINGQPFTLNLFQEILQHPRAGNRTRYRYYNDRVRVTFGDVSTESRWILATRDVLPESREKPYFEQGKLIDRYRSPSLPYVLPKVLDAVVSICTHYVATGKRLYPDKSENWTFTRCQETMTPSGDTKSPYGSPIAVGGYKEDGDGVEEGISISDDFGGPDRTGVMGVVDLGYLYALKEPYKE